jgi:MSHA biogenesis protein MshJ
MKAGTAIDRALLKRRLAPLISAWERQAKRIDALSLRERAILFLSIAAVLAALFDTLVLTPQANRARLRSEAQAQQAAELAQLREQFIAASRGSDPAGPLREQRDAAQAERARLDDQLRKAAALSEGEGLSVVLQRLLSQQPGVALERLALLADTPVAAASAASAPAGARPPLPVLAGMGWQGVELQLQGSYRELQRYLQALERELPGLRWGDMRLTAGRDGEPPRLVAQVFLLKVQP